MKTILLLITSVILFSSCGKNEPNSTSTPRSIEDRGNPLIGEVTPLADGGAYVEVISTTYGTRLYYVRGTRMSPVVMDSLPNSLVTIDTVTEAGRWAISEYRRKKATEKNE
jgi:hypothetical protein